MCDEEAGGEVSSPLEWLMRMEGLSSSSDAVEDVEVGSGGPKAKAAAAISAETMREENVSSGDDAEGEGIGEGKRRRRNGLDLGRPPCAPLSATVLDEKNSETKADSTVKEGRQQPLIQEVEQLGRLLDGSGEITEDCNVIMAENEVESDESRDDARDLRESAQGTRAAIRSRMEALEAMSEGRGCPGHPSDVSRIFDLEDFHYYHDDGAKTRNDGTGTAGDSSRSDTFLIGRRRRSRTSSWGSGATVGALLRKQLEDEVLPSLPIPASPNPHAPPARPGGGLVRACGTASRRMMITKQSSISTFVEGLGEEIIPSNTSSTSRRSSASPPHSPTRCHHARGPNNALSGSDNEELKARKVHPRCPAVQRQKSLSKMLNAALRDEKVTSSPPSSPWQQDCQPDLPLRRASLDDELHPRGNNTDSVVSESDSNTRGLAVGNDCTDNLKAQSGQSTKICKHKVEEGKQLLGRHIGLDDFLGVDEQDVPPPSHCGNGEDGYSMCSNVLGSTGVARGRALSTALTRRRPPADSNRSDSLLIGAAVPLPRRVQRQKRHSESKKRRAMSFDDLAALEDEILSPINDDDDYMVHGGNNNGSSSWSNRRLSFDNLAALKDRVLSALQDEWCDDENDEACHRNSDDEYAAENVANIPDSSRSDTFLLGAMKRTRRRRSRGAAVVDGACRRFSLEEEELPSSSSSATKTGNNRPASPVRRTSAERLLAILSSRVSSAVTTSLESEEVNKANPPPPHPPNAAEWCQEDCSASPLTLSSPSSPPRASVRRSRRPGRRAPQPVLQMSGLHLLSGNGANSTGPVPNKSGGKRTSMGLSVASSFMGAMEIDDLRKIIVKEEELPTQASSRRSGGHPVFRGLMRQISASVLRKEGAATSSSPDGAGESWRSEEAEGDESIMLAIPVSSVVEERQTSRIPQDEEGTAEEVVGVSRDFEQDRPNDGDEEAPRRQSRSRTSLPHMVSDRDAGFSDYNLLTMRAEDLRWGGLLHGGAIHE